MKNKMFLFALCLYACFPKGATTDEETVWLRDVTTQLQTDKGGVTGSELPDKLSFHLKRRTQNLILNLKRTDIYFRQKLKNGRSVLEKKQNVGKADVANYHDMENGAFMTARCVKRASGQCDIIINGNIRLGDRNYNLRPSEVDVIQNNFLEIMGLRGKRYVLQDQENIQSGMSVENNEQTNVIEKNVQEKYIDGLRRISYGQVKTYMKSLEIPVTDKTRNRNNYYVEVVAMADSSVWDFFYAIAGDSGPLTRVDKTHRSLKEYFLHIVNGADQLYKGIEDPSISIDVSIRAFITLPLETDFPHHASKVQRTVNKTKIDGDKYLQDLSDYDISVAQHYLPRFDQLILFTRHALYSGTRADTDDNGRSIKSGVCHPGRRIQIVRVSDFFSTIRSTAHGLGHSLGAKHDESQHSRSRGKYIMSRIKPSFYTIKNYTLDDWEFSNVSVEAFKSKLVIKTCLNTKHVHDQDIQAEMSNILRQQPGQRYSTNEQCVFKNGIGSTYTGIKPELVCSTMRCSYPGTKRWDKIFIPAAQGTECGNNMHCQKGLCVATQ